MFTYKTVLVGDFGTGKTSLIKRYVDNSFSEDYISTIGVSISKKELSFIEDDKEYKSTVLLWDIEGKTDFKPVFTQYLNGSKAFVVVADLTRKKTIDSLREHIELCQSVVSDAPICIALNKSDLINSHIDFEELKNLSPNIIAVFKTSAKDSLGVVEIFDELNKSVLKKVLDVK